MFSAHCLAYPYLSGVDPGDDGGGGRGWSFIFAVLLSFVFFNVYEHTDVGKKLPIIGGWRGALLIGFLSRAGAERIFAALKALLGG